MGETRVASQSREQELLLCCARARPSAGARRQIAACCRGPVDWDGLLALAEAHGVWPLLLPSLRAAGAAVPPHVQERLSRQFVEHTALSLAWAAQLAEVLALLREHDIPATALKGLTLAAAAYGHPALRVFTDLDVLVAPKNVSRARDVLLANGYRRAEAYSPLDGVYPPAGREYGLLPSRPGLAPVEIKGSITSWALPIGLASSDLIARSVGVDVGGAAIATLDPVDHLLALAVHGTRHQWRLLRWLTDIDAASRVDWPVALARSREGRMGRMLAVALLSAHDLLETELPEDVLAGATRDRPARRLATQVTARVFGGVRPVFSHVWTDWLSVQSREHALDKLRYGVRGMAFEWVIQPLDQWTTLGVREGGWPLRMVKRLTILLLALAAYGASWTARPVGAALLSAVVIAGVSRAVTLRIGRALASRSGLPAGRNASRLRPLARHRLERRLD
jgi:hypothetical protein